MSSRKSILSISGSTRRESVNLKIINSIKEIYQNEFDFADSIGIENIPHFNPDLDTENPPEEVVRFRDQLRSADIILICTPEYAMGVPGTLKNAIDWTVSSCEFSHKKVVLITASSMGEKAHASMLGTLTIIEADVLESNLHIPFARTKLNLEGKIADEEVLSKLEKIFFTIKSKS